MSTLTWYWHRLRAMGPAELLLHARKKLRQRADAGRLPEWTTPGLDAPEAFPKLPLPANAPVELREALRRDTEDILAGRWKAFGHLQLKVDDPPKWHCDYLAGRDLATAEGAFQLDHRALPGGADIKLIWELSRWHPLTRLAMAAYVLDDGRAAAKCVDWLEDWGKRNLPYHGWNWTSALEVGMRLIQFTWIDALLQAAPAASGLGSRRAGLREALLPSHVRFAWRYRSFGSSANNHLLGELAGCIVATARWPSLARWCASPDALQRAWEREVLSQFAEDGGNREQALNYQLFSWELCWLAFRAFEFQKRARGLVEQRLAFAARFFWAMQARTDPWDYGDSDNAFVVPFFARTDQAVSEWHRWFEAPVQSPAIAYWLGDAPTLHPPLARGAPMNTITIGEWWVYPQSRIGICESGYWFLRWDLSNLGYLATAAHGHLDALHLSIWFKGVALIIDPGTGAYYADPGLRHWLASRAAHNAPCPSAPEQPRRLGPFLWADNHAAPAVSRDGAGTIGVLSFIGQQMRRAIEPLPEGAGWLVKDRCVGKDGRPVDFTVRWQFAPETFVKRVDERRFLLRRHEVEIEIQVSAGWADVVLVELDALPPEGPAPSAAPANLEGLVSPGFRRTVRAPFLKLVARPGVRPGVFTSSILARPPVVL